MQLKFECIFSDKEFEVWRIGLWEFTRTRDGEAFWIWTGAENELRIRQTAARQPREISGGHQPGKVAEDLREASANGALRRAALPRVPSRARVQESHSWDALLKPDKAS